MYALHILRHSKIDRFKKQKSLNLNLVPRRVTNTSSKSVKSLNKNAKLCVPNNLASKRITIEKPYKKTLNKFDKMCKNITAMSHSPKIPSKHWNKSSSVPNDNFSRKFTQICMLRGNHELSTSSVTNKKIISLYGS
jgi:hypothetical protein